MQVYTFNTRNRFVAVLAALVVLGAGAALLLVGLALLAGLAVAGGVLGAGVMAYRAIRGGRGGSLRGASSSGDLDPSREVFAETRGVESADVPNDESRRIAPE
jgi:hypothetical protein